MVDAGRLLVTEGIKSPGHFRQEADMRQKADNSNEELY
jgi:hypothetical protein